MKTFILLVIGAIIGLVGYHYYQRFQHPTLAQQAGAAADATKETAGSFKDTVVAKSKQVGETMDDARITTVIKGKYTLDKDLSVFAISVSCTDGKVLLTGTVASDELAARAARLARETGGVVGVNAQLVVKN